jgi:carboxyl-terminal processing protease
MLQRCPVRALLLPLAVRRLAAALTVGAGLLAGMAQAQETELPVSPDPATADVLPGGDQPGQLPLTELRIFADVFNQIRTSYVEEVDDRTLLENAIKGMLSGLDPHSAYLDEESFADLREHTTGEFGGVGLEVGVDSNGFVRVITPIDDTPASAAGIESGDLIIKLDGKSVKGLGLNEAVTMMRGPKGSKIELTIVREGTPAPFDVTLTRDVIKVQSVRERLLEPGFGYLRIAQFQNETGADMLAAIKRMQKESKGSLHGVVLDLRNNPGGVLQSSVEVADAFLESGLIVYTEGRVENARSRFSAASGDELGGAPMVVLINGGSASASEIVAGALQDHKRAIVVGTDSFGKGSVQTVLPLREKRAIKLTTARYFTPNGRSIQAQGIIPDIVVERAEVTTIASAPRVTEADLARHLSNGNGKGENGSRERSTPNVSVDLRSDDNQLYEALNLLKGIALTRSSEPPASQPETPPG